MSRDYHCPITTTVTSCPRITYRFGNRQFENKKWELSASYRQPGVTQSASFLFNNSRLRIPPTEEWDKLPQQLLDNVMQSMVRRVECCITLHGGHIPY
ncbi:hypothetical protein TNCV_1995761 [Trichonephila clavipes]|nr:hypothetical protein TNCV_1995761 [Trichonephila clavipes]